MDDPAKIGRVAEILAYAREVRDYGDIVFLELLAWTDSRDHQ